ncbi:MAG TPA: hypothetical protein VK306_07835 [Acidimicrobiales bacterium]|nr:hypothetical protein [Acidimicrobiales bacterium]
MTSNTDSGEADRNAEGEIVEPPNSTVDDWMGQQVQRDDQLVDELLDETGGDSEKAEELFEQRTNEDRPDSLPTDERRTS